MLAPRMKRALGELELIERIRSGWAGQGTGHGLVLGIGDDCAVLRPPRGHEVVVTTDFTLEGRHFRRDWHTPESAGHRALARGLSDLAAMGAKPMAAFLSLALPKEMLASRAGRAWVERFFTGMRELADRCGSPLAGGDTSESPCALVLADIVLVGSTPTGKALRRSGGKAGDALYVTGALGGAAAELAAMARRGPRVKAQRAGEHPQMFPEPRLGVGQALLRRRLATACMDLSDGLSSDLAQLCRASGVGAEIEAASVPIHPMAKGDVELALHGAEDYELLFAAPHAVQMPRSVAGVRVTRIGRMVQGSGVWIVDDKGGRVLEPGGWEHFVRDVKIES